MKATEFVNFIVRALDWQYRQEKPHSDEANQIQGKIDQMSIIKEYSRGIDVDVFNFSVLLNTLGHSNIQYFGIPWAYQYAHIARAARYVVRPTGQDTVIDNGLKTFIDWKKALSDGLDLTQIAREKYIPLEQIINLWIDPVLFHYGIQEPNTEAFFTYPLFSPLISKKRRVQKKDKQPIKQLEENQETKVYVVDVKAIKVIIPVPVEDLPTDCLPPPGEKILPIELEFRHGDVTLKATISGRSYKKAMKKFVPGAFVMIQGKLGADNTLVQCGLTVQVPKKKADSSSSS